MPDHTSERRTAAAIFPVKPPRWCVPKVGLRLPSLLVPPLPFFAGGFCGLGGGSTLSLPATQFQLCDRTRHGFGHKGIEAFQHTQHAAHPDEAPTTGSLPLPFPAVLWCRLGNSGLLGQLALRQIALQANAGQSPTQFREHCVIGGLFGYFHNTPNMANSVQFVNLIAIYGELQSKSHIVT